MQICSFATREREFLKLGDSFFTTKDTNEHENFSCPFGHFVVKKEFLAYPGSLVPYDFLNHFIKKFACFCLTKSYLSLFYAQILDFLFVKAFGCW